MCPKYKSDGGMFENVSGFTSCSCLDKLLITLVLACKSNAGS